MRCALILAFALTASASAQPDMATLDRDALVAQARAQVPAADGDPEFVAAWADPAFGRGGGGGNVNEGTYGARGMAIHQVLIAGWTAAYPFSADPIPLSIRSRLIDLPHSLERRLVDVGWSARN